jgi:hypothetical protein
LPLCGPKLGRLVLQVACAAQRQASSLHDAVRCGGPAELQQQPGVLAEGRRVARDVAHPALERSAQEILPPEDLERAQLHAPEERFARTPRDERIEGCEQ